MRCGCAPSLVGGLCIDARRETEIGDLDLQGERRTRPDGLALTAGQLITRRRVRSHCEVDETANERVAPRTVRADAAIGAPHPHDALGRWRIALK
jgi:hypothetical protein